MDRKPSECGRIWVCEMWKVCVGVCVGRGAIAPNVETVFRASHVNSSDTMSCQSPWAGHQNKINQWLDWLIVWSYKMITNTLVTSVALLLFFEHRDTVWGKENEPIEKRFGKTICTVLQAHRRTWCGLPYLEMCLMQTEMVVAKGGQLPVWKRITHGVQLRDSFY